MRWVRWGIVTRTMTASAKMIVAALVTLGVAYAASAQLYVVRRPIPAGGGTTENGQLLLAGIINYSTSGQCFAAQFFSSADCATTEVPMPVALRVTGGRVVCDSNPTNAIPLKLRKNTATDTDLCTVPTSGDPVCSASGLTLDLSAQDRLGVRETAAAGSDIRCRVMLAIEANGGGGTSDAVVVTGPNGTGVTGPVTRYCGPFGTNANYAQSCADSTWAGFLLPTTATFSGIAFRAASVLSAGCTETITTKQRDPSDTDTGVTLASTVQLDESINADAAACSSGCSIAAGNQLFGENAIVGTGAAEYRAVGWAFDGVGAIVSAWDNQTVATTTYVYPFGESTTETAALIPIARSGTIRNLRVWAASTFTDHPTVTVRTGGYSSMADSALTCTTSASGCSGKSCCSDTSNSVAVSAGDYMVFKVVKTGSNETRSLRMSVEIAP